MEKSTLFAISLFLCLPYFSETTHYTIKSPYQPFTIVLDAGHGGKDSGALGSNSQEKDIALKLALKLGKYINQHLPSVQVLYTRKTDKFIPLHERIDLANRNNADVFFSIHCNSMVTKPSSANGTETFVMGLHRATENLNVAKRENKTILMEQNYTKHYNGYDPNSSEGHIMLSMYQNAYLSQSLALAQKVEKQFEVSASRKSRGVKQAGFLVLRAATMPSILVEAGFLSNTKEEVYLKSEKGQVYIASAMYRAIKAYKSEVQKKTNPNYQAVVGKTTYQAPQKTYKATAPVSQTPRKNYKNYTSTPHKHVDKRVDMSSSNSNNGTIRAPRTNQIQKNTTISIVEAPSIERMYPSSFSKKGTNEIASTTKKKAVVEYKVQLAASTNKVDLGTGVWKSIKGIECKKIGSSYKCLIGKFDNITAAMGSQTYWRKNGFKDAFIVAFRDGQKVSLSEATK